MKAKLSVDLGDDDMPDIKTMTRAELDKIPFDKFYWHCGVDGCTHKTNVRDYGIDPVFYWPVGREKWPDVTQQFFLCWKHWKQYRRFWDNQARTDVEQPEAYGAKCPIRVKTKS